jgi:hypothetical protein
MRDSGAWISKWTKEVLIMKTSLKLAGAALTGALVFATTVPAMAAEQSAGNDLRWIKHVQQTATEQQHVAPVASPDLAADQTTVKDLMWLRKVQQGASESLEVTPNVAPDELASNQDAGQDLRWIKSVQSGTDYS